MDYRTIIKDARHIVESLMPISTDMKKILTFLKTQEDKLAEHTEYWNKIEEERKKVLAQYNSIQLKIWQAKFRENWANAEYEIRNYYLKVF